MADLSIFAFEVNLSLVRSNLFSKGGLMSKPKPPNVDELQAGLEALWHPVDDLVFSRLSDATPNVLRYFYGAAMAENEGASVGNSFANLSVISPEAVSGVKVYPLADREDRFIGSQIKQMLREKEESEDFEIGVLYVTDIAKEDVEQVFKDAYIEFSEKQNGELHLLTFASNGILNTSLGNLPNAVLGGALAGEADGRISEATLDVSALGRLLTTLNIGPSGDSFEATIHSRLQPGNLITNEQQINVGKEQTETVNKASQAPLVQTETGNKASQAPLVQAETGNKAYQASMMKEVSLSKLEIHDGSISKPKIKKSYEFKEYDLTEKSN